MFGIDSTGAVSVMPVLAGAGTSGFFTGGNPSSGEQATVVTADWLNIIQSELLNVLMAAGVTPAKGSLNQLAISIQKLAGIAPYSGSYATAIGGYPVNAVVSDATTSGKYWRSTADANMTTPGASGASWVDFFADITTILTGITSPVLVTSSTSITAPSWATRVEVIAVGAGAGGSDCQATGSTIANTNASGGGGGAGANARAILPITSGQTLVLNIGAAGGPEGNGGATTVYVGDTLALTCNGGAKSGFTQTGNSPGGYGGTVSLTLTGGVLLENSPGSPGSDGQNGGFIKSGKGGDGRWGGAGRDGQGAGESATGFGAGGGGAYDSAFSNTLYTGGSGFQGCCIYRFLP